MLLDYRQHIALRFNDCGHDRAVYGEANEARIQMRFMPELLDSLHQRVNGVIRQHIHHLAAMPEAEIQEVQQQHFLLGSAPPEAQTHQPRLRG